MDSRFWSRPWGPETFRWTDDTDAFDIAGRTAKVTPPLGCSPRAMTAVFFAGGDGPGDHFGDVQHVQHADWRIDPLTLVARALQALYGALAPDLQVAGPLGIDLANDPAAVGVGRLARALKVPPPPKSSWQAAVVALYAPKTLNAISIGWGVVKDPSICR